MTDNTDLYDIRHQYNRDVSDIDCNNFVLDDAATNLNAFEEVTEHSSVFDNILYDVNHLQNNPSGPWLSHGITPNSNSWSHPAPIALNTFDFQNDMNMGLTPEDIALTTPTTSSTSLKCHLPACLEINDFPSKPALDKHIEKKHTKPHLCLVPNCKHPRFGDKAGLDRHKREVHSSQSFLCPITSCKRHIKPFHRQYNVTDHMKRCHPQANRVRTILQPRPTSVNYQQNEEGSESTAEPMSPDSVVSGETLDERSRSQRVKEKLDRLRAMRAEIDADIQAIERAEEILES